MTVSIVGKLYPIPLMDYPKLLRYKVTPSGIHYIEDLMREIYIEKNKLTDCDAVKSADIIKLDDFRSRQSA